MPEKAILLTALEIKILLVRSIDLDGADPGGQTTFYDGRNIATLI